MDMHELVKNLNDHQQNELLDILLSRSHNILQLCPSLKALVANLQDRPMNEGDLPLAQAVCNELAQHRTHIHKFKGTVSRIGSFTERVVLFCGENLEIRAHLFAPGAGETFVHDHQHSFISCCIQGGYTHKLHSVVDDNGTHYSFKRETGGIYTLLGEHKGKPTTILSQPFEAGQSLFISAFAKHTVEPQEGVPVATITFRDLRTRASTCTVLHSQDALPKTSTEETVNITSPSTIQDITERLTNTLKEFHTNCIARLAPMQKVIEVVQETNRKIEEMNNKHKLARYIELLTLSDFIALWHSNKQLPPSNILVHVQAIVNRLANYPIQISSTSSPNSFGNKLLGILPNSEEKAMKHILSASGLMDGDFYDEEVAADLARVCSLPVGVPGSTKDQKWEFLMCAHEFVIKSMFG